MSRHICSTSSSTVSNASSWRRKRRELDAHRAVVGVAVEADQVGLDDRALDVAEGRVAADRDRGGIALLAGPEDAEAGVDAGRRHDAPGRPAQVRGRHAERAAARESAHDGAVEPRVAAEQARRVLDLALAHELADPGRRDALAVGGHERDCRHAEAEPLAERGQRRRVALGGVAEAVVLAHDDVHGARSGRPAPARRRPPARAARARA